MTARVCSVAGCGRRHLCRGLCSMHDLRLRRTGDIGPPGKIYGTDEIGYWAAHDRVRAARGPASQHYCWKCGGPARDWALSRNAADPRPSRHGWFSPSPDDYVPMCRKCHIPYDAETARARRLIAELRHPATSDPDGTLPDRLAACDTIAEVEALHAEVFGGGR